MRTRTAEDGSKEDGGPPFADDPFKDLANGGPEFEASEDPTRSDVAALAYQIWEERGRPHGSPDDDWYEAERRFKDGAR